MEILDGNCEPESMSEIQSFFKDASVFLTGATGFLGHVLMSKLLRSCPDIKEIFILLREKRGKTAMDRFKEMLEDEVFEVIKTECPQSLSKIRPIIGDCLKSGLGLSPLDRSTMTERVNVIFHVAATVRFDAPLRDAVHMNIRSTSDMLDLAHEMKQLKAFVHVSTAFSNCVGRKVIEEKLYSPPVSSEKLMDLVDRLDDEILERITPGLLGDYPNTYVFTKAIAEEICKIKGTDLPLTIFRPAIVISTMKEPIPGWINNVYGPTGVAAACAVGLMRTLYSDENCKANVVPCDYVVNAAIASAWSVGTKNNKNTPTNISNGHLSNGNIPNGISKEKANAILPNLSLSNGIMSNGNITNGTLPKPNMTYGNCAKLEDSKNIEVYNYSCDILKKPFTWKEFMALNEKQEPLMPSSVSMWTYSLTLCKYKPLYQMYCFLLHIVPAFIVDNIAKLLGKEPKLMDAYKKLHKLADVLSYFSTREWKMTNTNVLQLWQRLSKKDKEIFDFDMNAIDWEHYYYIHCFGIRKFIMKENPETIPSAIKRRKRLVFMHYVLVSTIVLLSSYLCLNFLRRYIFG